MLYKYECLNNVFRTSAVNVTFREVLPWKRKTLLVVVLDVACVALVALCANGDHSKMGQSISKVFYPKFACL